jgi:quercetin dioxygenase-like cupin family protein
MALPQTTTHQEHLLTINTNAHPFLKSLGGYEGIDLFPMFLDPYNGLMVVRSRFAPGLTLPLHFHTGVVHMYTMKGCWYYTEYPEQKQTEGCYLYEPGGSVHQFNTPADNDGPTDVIFLLFGANVNYAQDGTYLGLSDTGMIKNWIDRAIKEQDSQVRYISDGMPTLSA